ncbi:MAG: hypothetical protein M0Z69_15815 [Actinomycetota bacterium]|nr:hypothetical protein [Actinomycetota bacterium]
MPGVVGISVTFQDVQSIALNMAQELGFTREIEDRVQAPRPVWLVAVTKVISGAVHGILPAAIVLPIASVVQASGVEAHLGLVEAGLDDRDGHFAHPVSRALLTSKEVSSQKGSEIDAHDDARAGGAGSWTRRGDRVGGGKHDEAGPVPPNRPNPQRGRPNPQRGRLNPQRGRPNPAEAAPAPLTRGALRYVPARAAGRGHGAGESGPSDRHAQRR